MVWRQSGVIANLLWVTSFKANWNFNQNKHTVFQENASGDIVMVDIGPGFKANPTVFNKTSADANRQSMPLTQKVVAIFKMARVCPKTI